MDNDINILQIDQYAHSSIGRLAIEHDFITAAQLLECLKRNHDAPEKKLGEIFAEFGYISGYQLNKLLQRQEQSRQICSWIYLPDTVLKGLIFFHDPYHQDITVQSIQKAEQIRATRYLSSRQFFSLHEILIELIPKSEALLRELTAKIKMSALQCPKCSRIYHIFSDKKISEDIPCTICWDTMLVSGRDNSPNQFQENELDIDTVIKPYRSVELAIVYQTLKDLEPSSEVAKIRQISKDNNTVRRVFNALTRQFKKENLPTSEIPNDIAVVPCQPESVPLKKPETDIAEKIAPKKKPSPEIAWKSPRKILLNDRSQPLDRGKRVYPWAVLAMLLFLGGFFLLLVLPRGKKSPINDRPQINLLADQPQPKSIEQSQKKQMEPSSPSTQKTPTNQAKKTTPMVKKQTAPFFFPADAVAVSCLKTAPKNLVNLAKEMQKNVDNFLEHREMEKKGDLKSDKIPRNSSMTSYSLAHARWLAKLDFLIGKKLPLENAKYECQKLQIAIEKIRKCQKALYDLENLIYRRIQVGNISAKNIWQVIKQAKGDRQLATVKSLLKDLETTN